MSRRILKTSLIVLGAYTAHNFIYSTVSTLAASLYNRVSPPADIKLYGSSLSTCTQRVATVFRELNVPFDFQPIDFSKREHKSDVHLQRQPFGQVPVIDDSGFLLFESRAIGRYLASKHSPNHLVPAASDVKAWARFEQAASIEQSNFDPYASGLLYERILNPRKGIAADEKRVETLVQNLDAKLDAYETILRNSTYLAGDTFTLADLFHLPYGAVVTDRLGLDLLTNPKRPNVARWWAAISSRPAWQSVKGGVN